MGFKPRYDCELLPPSSLLIFSRCNLLLVRANSDRKSAVRECMASISTEEMSEAMSPLDDDSSHFPPSETRPDVTLPGSKSLRFSRDSPEPSTFDFPLLERGEYVPSPVKDNSSDRSRNDPSSRLRRGRVEAALEDDDRPPDAADTDDFQRRAISVETAGSIGLNSSSAMEAPAAWKTSRFRAECRIHSMIAGAVLQPFHFYMYDKRQSAFVSPLKILCRLLSIKTIQRHEGRCGGSVAQPSLMFARRGEVDEG
mmetsp:Transcript_42477/g.128898  ORF Transcript_42477/g.128898 Transcript_42477/m.128898 type:complete len:254 (+) Transcript_42477:3608-4369(+)